MKRILVVSSDRHLLNVLRRELSLRNYMVLTENDPHRVLPDIDSFAPDLLIVDLILNNNNGGAISRQLKTDLQTKELPIILLSDYERETYYPSRFGCDMVLQKTEDIHPLIDAINNLLQENELIPS